MDFSFYAINIFSSLFSDSHANNFLKPYCKYVRDILNELVAPFIKLSK